MNIILVEDQAPRYKTIIKRLSDFLSEDNHRLHVFEDWKQAFQFYKSKKNDFDLFIIDIRMPETIGNVINPKYDKVTGLRLYDMIKQINENQKFLFWTVLDKEEIEKEGYSIVNGDYVEKTSDHSLFFSKIDEKIKTNLMEKLDKIFSDEV